MSAHLRLRRALPVAVVLAIQAAAAPQGQQPRPQPYTTWTQYGGSSDSMQYSALTQIDKTNVTRLRQAWFYQIAGEPARLLFNPIVVDNVMYVAGVDRVVVALDAGTGKELWMSTLRAPERGVTYWESADRSDRRLILTTDNGIREIDARTGRQIMTFGANGFVDMRAGFPRRNGGPSNSPGRVFENLLIVGSVTGELYGSPPGDIRAYDVVTGKLVWTFHTIPRPGEFGYETWPEDAFRRVGGANTWGDITVDDKNGIVFLPTGSPTYDLYGGDRKGDNLFGNCLLALDARTGKRLWHFQTVHHDTWDYDNTSPPKLLTVVHDGKPIDIVAQAGKTGFLYVFERKTGRPIWPIEERPVPKSNVPGEFSSPTQPFPTAPPPFARQSMTPEEVTPFVSPEERAELQQLLRESANNGVFTPPNHERYAIEFPGAWGGANFASSAGDPANGMVFIRSYEQISRRKMLPGNQDEGDRRRRPAPELGPVEQEGQAVYMQQCSTCHGAGQVPMRSIKAIGDEQFRALVRRGNPPMPAFSQSRISDKALDALEAYLTALPTSDERAGNPSEIRLPQSPNRYQGPPGGFAGSSFAAAWNASNGYPAAGPPWSRLTAYDLNTGTIKWQIADGAPPALAAKGTKNTGTQRPRNAPVVTAGGLVFLANTQDGFLRAFDENTGALLWEHELDGNPEGIPAVYEANGREYVAFAVGAWVGTEAEKKRTDAIQRKFGKPEAQGYYVFALDR